MATLNIKDFPDRLYQRLKKRAAREHRSLAQEVTRMLEQVMEAREPLSIMELEGLGAEVWNGTDATAYVDAERRAWRVAE